MRKAFIHSVMPFVLGGSLVKQIVVGFVLGVIAAWFLPDAAVSCGFAGKLFVSALKAVAPVIVFMLVMAAVANQDIEAKSQMKPILLLYVAGTFLAAFASVSASFLFPVEIRLAASQTAQGAPVTISDVLGNLVLSLVDNPMKAIVNANYIGILVWAVGLGIALRRASQETRNMVSDLASGVEMIVRVVIRFAPIGVFGIAANTFATEGFEALAGYAKLLAVLLGSMAAVALLLNPLLVWVCIRRNPYPLTLAALRESGVTAFFTRSSAANIPVNMEFCRKLGLDEGTYGVSIPLGATINMAGAAITITVLTLAACNSLGIHADFLSSVLLSVVASLCACGAAGVPGGSLMLIPLACGLFGIDNDTAMQVVAVGFIIGVVQDSAETGLNSSSDALFTAAACLRAERLKESSSR